MFGLHRKTESIGARGERVAAKWLRKQRYKVIGKNVHVGVGEADIVCVAPDRRTIVIVEVKARVAQSKDGPRPERNVGRKKQQKLRLVTAAVVKKFGYKDRPVRIDVIGVEFVEGSKPLIRHHPAAVSG